MIEPANLRDLSYVFSNLRPTDLDEMVAEHGRWVPARVAAPVVEQPYAYISRTKNGVPAVGFGALPVTPTTVSAWLLATTGATRCIPEVTRFVDGPLRRQLVRDGYRWAEARALACNSFGRRWLAALGGQVIAELSGYGVNGEDFVLYRGSLTNA